MRFTLYIGLLALLAAPAAHASVIGVNDDSARMNYSAAAAKLAPLGNVQVGVWLANPNDSRWTVPNSRSVLLQMYGGRWWIDHPLAYAARARQLVMLHPNIREIQVWNEEDTCWFPCAPISGGVRFYGPYVDRYLDLLAMVHDALMGTGVKVLAFGLSPGIDSKWTPEALAEGIASWYERRGTQRWYGPGWDDARLIGKPYPRPIMDGFAYHPYTARLLRQTERIYDALHLFLRDMPGGVPKLWWTEAGMDTDAILAGSGSGTEAQQAERVGSMLAQAQSNPHVGGVFNFLLSDDLHGWHSGLYRPDGSAKPALTAFRAAIRPR